MTGFPTRCFHVFVVPSETLILYMYIILMADCVLIALFFLKTLSFTFLGNKYISPVIFLSCGCHRKYMDEKLHIEDGRANFECAWLSNPTTNGHPVIFPKHLQQIDKMAKWVRDTI